MLSGASEWSVSASLPHRQPLIITGFLEALSAPHHVGFLESPVLAMKQALEMESLPVGYL